MARRAPLRGEHGAAAVEFALVSVLLLTLLFGIIQYAYFFFQSQGGSATTREAARLAAVGVTDCSTFKTAVGSRATANGTDVASSASAIALTVTKSSGNTGANPEVGDLAMVSVTWVPQRFGFPFVPFLSGDYTSSAETRVENVGTMLGLSC